jgi:hypothetical protein
MMPSIGCSVDFSHPSPSSLSLTTMSQPESSPVAPTVYAVTQNCPKKAHDHELDNLTIKAKYDLARFVDDDNTAAATNEDEARILELEAAIAALESDSIQEKLKLELVEEIAKYATTMDNQVKSLQCNMSSE